MDGGARDPNARRRPQARSRPGQKEPSSPSLRADADSRPPIHVQGRIGDEAFTVTVRLESVTIGLEGPGASRTVAACDRAGRLYSFWRDGHTFRRGLGGRILHKWSDDRGRHWDWPEGADADGVVDAAAAVFERVHDAVKTGQGRWSPEPEHMRRIEIWAALLLGARFTADAARADAARFARVYAPIGILPPDQYLATVVQATRGCSFTSCTFCDLYHEPYHVKSAFELHQHVEAVLAYLGPSRLLRNRSIFLGAANALAVPMGRLYKMFEVLERQLDARRHGVTAFVDAFTGARKTAGDYRALGKLGLRRVYVGLESGHDPLLDFVRKPGTSDTAIETVRAVKAAGLAAGVIVMVGLGGDQFAEGHVADTIAAVNAMGLGAGDFLYFSDLVPIPGTTYPTLAEAANVRALTPAERHAQRQAIQGGLRFAGPPPKVASYDIREFVY
jgi:hypothetical protein